MSKEAIIKLTSDHIKVKGAEYVQDLVRCQDCKFWIDNCDEDSDLFRECRWRDDETTDADDFCSYGEVRDE